MVFYIIIRGPLGIGKSTISEALARDIKAQYIPIDRILDQHNLTKEWEDGYISQKSFIKANEITVPKAKKLLDMGKTVIFDGNFYWKSQIDDLIKRLHYPHYVFTLKAPLEICIKRDNERVKTHGKDAAEAVYKKSAQLEYGIVIETENKSVKDVVNEIEKRLK